MQRMTMDGVVYRRLKGAERPTAVLTLASRRAEASPVVRNLLGLVGLNREGFFVRSGQQRCHGSEGRDPIHAQRIVVDLPANHAWQPRSLKRHGASQRRTTSPAAGRQRDSYASTCGGGFARRASSRRPHRQRRAGNGVDPSVRRKLARIRQQILVARSGPHPNLHRHAGRRGVDTVPIDFYPAAHREPAPRRPTDPRPSSIACSWWATHPGCKQCGQSGVIFQMVLMWMNAKFIKFFTCLACASRKVSLQTCTEPGLDAAGFARPSGVAAILMRDKSMDKRGHRPPRGADE